MILVIIMTTLFKLIAISRAVLEKPSTLIESRFSPRYFTRIRKMPFPKLLKYLLSMFKTSTQAALNVFFEEENIIMSQQALSKARSKFDHTPFLKLFIAVRDALYCESNRAYLTLFDEKYYLVAIDGSELALPNVPKLLDSYGGTGSKASSPTARISMAYDVLNDYVIDASITPLSVDERTHAFNHIEAVENIINPAQILYLFDRGYPSEELIRRVSDQSHYLMRVKTKFNKKIDDLPLGSHVITLYGNIRVRVFKFTLPSGEVEMLISNLFDLPDEAFKPLYFKRWGIEIKYDVVKNKLELPNFNGFTENIILQDFWISMYMLNIAAVAKHEADAEIQAERIDKDNKFEYQANVNTIIGSLRNRFAEAVFSHSKVIRMRKINRIMSEIKRSVVPVRPDNTAVRYKNPRKTKFHHNKKSNL